MSNAPRKPIRWRGALAILILAAVALIVIWTIDSSRQDRILRTGITLVVSALLLFLWAILFSRFTGKSRLTIFVSAGALIACAKTSLEITGVTGDLLPIVRFRRDKPAPFTTNTRPSTNQIFSTASFPQFLGPNRDGIIRENSLNTNWTAHPPQLLWRHMLGGAWSGFVIAEGIAVTQEQRGEEELVTAYNLLDGQPLWSHSDSTRYFTTLGGEGPRATPTIISNRVYALGANGLLNCLDLKSGKKIWSKDMAKEHAAGIPSWGFSGSPLLHNGLVIVNAGGKENRSLVAHNAETGDFVWGGGDDSAGYSSPTFLTLAGLPQIVLFNHKQVEGHNPASGAVLWTHPWTTSHPHIAMPIAISTNQLLVSSGYGYGSELLEISATNATRLWKSNRLKSKFANLILHEKYVYGLDDGILTCLDPATGERKWHGDRHGHGQMLLVGNIILMMAENGEVLLIEPSPEQERVIARLKVFKDKTWNPPALAGEYLLIRNNLEAACFKLPLAAAKK